MKNEKEFLELKALYKRIDIAWLEEVSEKYEHIHEAEWGEAVISEITGFGSRGSCTLCNVVKSHIPPEERLSSMLQRHFQECSKCAYVVMTGAACFKGDNRKTYNSFINARTLEDLEEACDAREKHMDNIYTKFKDLD